MIQISVFQLLFVFFVIFLVFVLAVGGRRYNDRRSGYGRRHVRHGRRRRRYDDEYDDDYDEDYYDRDHDRTGRDTGIGVLFIVLVIIGIATASRFDKSNANKKEAGKEVFVPNIPSSDTHDPLATIADKGKDKIQDRYVPNSDIVAQRAAKTEYYVRINELAKKDQVDRYCKEMIKKGLLISTLEKKGKTIVYVGPFESQERAEWENKEKGLHGTIESY